MRSFLPLRPEARPAECNAEQFARMPLTTQCVTKCKVLGAAGPHENGRTRALFLELGGRCGYQRRMRRGRFRCLAGACRVRADRARAMRFRRAARRADRQARGRQRRARAARAPRHPDREPRQSARCQHGQLRPDADPSRHRARDGLSRDGATACSMPTPI